MWTAFVQGIGYLGLVCAVIAFQCKAHKRVMIFRTLNELLFALQYFLLGSYTGVAMNIVGSVRNIGFAVCVARGKSTLLLQALFSVIFITSGALTFAGPVSIMVISAKVITTVAYGLKNTTYIRLLTLPTSACWLVYNAYCNSTAGILCEVFTICSILSAIVRIDIIEKRKAKRMGAPASSDEREKSGENSKAE